MATPEPAALEHAQVFQIHELFFSTTDRAGVILSGNEVFRRVAAFESIEEMIGKPHNVIRHPDVPRAVFRLLWDYLEAGKPIAAYVKNRAKNGAYYWVVALVLPVAGGYLSVRFKPSSPIFEIVQGLYKEMLRIEREAGNAPKVRDEGMRNATKAMVAALHGLGFADYDSFMRLALATEFQSRVKQMEPITANVENRQGEVAETLRQTIELEKTLASMFQQIDSFLEYIGQLESKSEFLSNLSGQIRLLALNSLISCHKMEDQGRGLAVVAQNMSEVAAFSTESITKVTAGIRDLIVALREIAFQVCSAKLQAEVTIVFLKELLEHGDDAYAERQRRDVQVLKMSFLATAGEIVKALPHVYVPVATLALLQRELFENVRGLSRAHLLGRIEASHVKEADTFLQLFSEVKSQIEAANKELEDFAVAISSLQAGLPTLERDSDRIVDEIEAFTPPEGIELVRTYAVA